jgi:hypothetical protein
MASAKIMEDGKRMGFHATKQGHLVPNWKRRFFLCDNEMRLITYWVTEEAALANEYDGKNFRGKINVKTIVRNESNLTINCRSGKVFQIRCEANSGHKCEEDAISLEQFFEGGGGNMMRGSAPMLQPMGSAGSMGGYQPYEGQQDNGGIVQLRLAHVAQTAAPITIMYPPQPGENTVNKYNSLGIQIEFSSDALYATEIYMVEAFATQALLPGMIITAVNGIDQGTKTYQQVFDQIGNRGNQRVSLTFRPGSRNNSANNAQMVEFNMPYPAAPGDRINAISPDGMKVDIIMGGDAIAHPGDVYMLLLSRTIPSQGQNDPSIFNGGGASPGGGAGNYGSAGARAKPKAHFTQTVGELQLLQEIEQVKIAMADEGPSGNTQYDMKQQQQREAELGQLELLRARVQMQGLRSEMNILRKEQSANEAGAGGAAPSETTERSMRERLRRMRLLEDELRKLQER